uniref:APRL6-Zea mays adenosine 5'-phosphosulfate reductase-like n=1 Tax=Zea mays TaxID=4577 RepID=B6UE94_MAIZE|nr:APRL6 - Zea mays adenosine 5'-phosphosulfate reductase-like [Zea mays]
MTRVLLPLLLLLALPGAYARPARQYLGQCPGLEYRLPPFAAALRATCPVSTEGYSSPYEVVSGEELLRMLDGKEEHTAVLFYASWCPFSQRTRSVFDDLSSMFPRVKHLAVEESSIMKAILSRYHVRALPSIIIARNSHVFWPLGSKDLDSLVSLYTAATGEEPVAYIGSRKWSAAQSTDGYAKAWNSSIISETVKREPYLALSILFICLRVFFFFFPKSFALIQDLWTGYREQINLGILGRLAQLLECVPHAVDVRKVWSKLRLVVGANENGRVWAALTSLPLGGRPSPIHGLLLD